MFRTLITRLQQQSAAYLHELYWFTALLSLLPAIRANLLFAFVQPVTSTFIPAGGETTPQILPALESPFGMWAFALAAVSLVLALASKRYWRLLAPVALLALGAADIPAGDDMLDDAVLGDDLPLLNNLYLVSAFLLFVYFVIAGSVRAPSFLLFALALLGLQQFDDQLAWPQTILFIVAAVVASLVAETVRQNLPLAKQLGRSNLIGLTWRTFRLWWPMLILIYIGVQLSNMMTSATEEALYATDAVQPYCYVDAVGPGAIMACPDATLRVTDTAFFRYSPDDDTTVCTYWPGWNPELPSTPMPPTFECPVADPTPDAWALTRLAFFDSADRSVERDFDVREWRLERQIRTMTNAVKRNADTLPGEARKLYDAVIPQTTGMKQSSCGLLKVSCHAANIVIGELNDAYIIARDNGEEEFVGYANSKRPLINSKTNEFGTALQGKMLSTLNAFERRTRNTIARVETAVFAVQRVLLLWLLVIAVKSFLFVFARVIFDQSTDIQVDLLEHDGDVQQGKVRQVQEVDIPADYPHTLYYKANYQPLGPAPRFSIPQWRASILSRLRFGAWNMSQVRMPLADDNRVTFNSIEGEHLVDWTLREGEEVVFSYRNFVAMNENIELRTVISLRVATLLLGRIVFHTARCRKGEGRLILRTRGKPATAAQVRQSIPVARLVAWNRYARFSVDSHLTTADIFLNGFNLRRTDGEDCSKPQGILIVEADARDGGILVGTLRFAKTFLLPV